MADCPKCNSTLYPRESQCYKCGHPAGKPYYQRNKKARSGGGKRKSEGGQWPSARAKAAIDEMEMKKFRRGLWVALVLLLISIGMYLLGVYLAVCIIFMLSFLIAIGNYVLSRSEDDYRSLPDATDENGGHRCVFCGNRGIYRHKRYQSETTLADCSRCGERLWTS